VQVSIAADPEIADLGIVGDLFKVAPRPTAAVKARKG
jgi:hypothetical protein